ncbi:hemolysin HlyE [Salmonella enterica]|nr:hemolysin HlyE [Salmonella enterica]EDW9763033.1 hemolysin HlyE [Salmonella enterica]
MTGIFAEQTVEVVKSAIETADGALDLYNKYLDQVIPWKTFDETIKELSRFKQEYSQAASVLVGDIKVLLMDSQDKYFEATQTVYEWCGVVTQLLSAYILLFDEYNEKKASAQKDILIRILDDGVNKLNEAQKSLLASSQSFNNASGKLLALDSQLTNDFSEKSSYFQSQVDRIRKEAYAGAAAGIVAGAAAGIVAGPFGLIISYSIAAGVIEGKLIPELNNRLKAVQNFFTSLSATVKQANKDIDAAKLKLATEIAAIGEIKTETETTRFYVDYDDLMLSLLKGAAKKMINTCNEYQQRHGKKTLLEVPDV